jgi:hypothetical protein
MKFLRRGIGLTVGGLALALAGSPFFAGDAWAQENLDQGKSGAQLFASDCAICHKTTAGLSKGRILGLDGFLREHYTASRESAATIAAYIQATDKGPAAPAPARATKKGAGKGDDKSKGVDKKSDKPGDAKSGDTKPAEAKPAEAKPAESNPKPSESKPTESKPSEGQPPDISKPEKKSD